MQSGNSTTNVILVLILVVVVAFGVWFFAYRTPDTDASQNPGVNIELTGGSDSKDSNP